MRKLTVPALLLVLILAFTGCEDDGNGDADNGDSEPVGDEDLVYKTEESLVDTFIKAANNQDKETFFNLFYDEATADAVWERITESELTFSPGYHIEDGPFGRHVIFDSARWEGFDTYEQQLYVSDDPALGGGWIINGQDYEFVVIEDTEEVVETEDVEPEL